MKEEKKPRICEQCGATYPFDSKDKVCKAKTSLGPCMGIILPKPEKGKS